MVAVILPNGHNNSGFGGLSYSLGKEDLGKGELMKMKNFPPHLNRNSKDFELRNHLIMKSNNPKGNRKAIKNPQLHVVISSEGFKDSKEDLTTVAEKWLDEMGYLKQPYVIVNHNDSSNNHVHIVTTRVDIETGKKINDSNEKYKSIDSLNRILGRTHKVKEQQKLLNYNFKSLGQIKVILNKYNIPYNEKDDNISLKWGSKDYLFKKEDLGKNKENVKRKIQIKAVMHNYKDKFNKDVFMITGKKPEYNSELIKSLRERFGLEIVFHTKDEKKPFGYSLIDHKTQDVYKGSDILKMNEICNFTDNRITKDYYEELMLFKYDSLNSAKEILKHKDFMLPLIDVKKGLKAKEHLKEWRNYNNCNDFMKDYNCQIINNDDGRTIIKNNYSKEVTDVTYDKHFQGLNYFKENNHHQMEEIYYEFEPIGSKHNHQLQNLIGQFSSVFTDENTDIPVKKKKKRKIKR